jgi:8-oxo-dGTP diphosphatase
MINTAVVGLIIKDGLILGISRRNDKTKYGLIGGKVNPKETLMEALIREVKEESDLKVRDCDFIYQRTFLENDMEWQAYCYYITDWLGEPKSNSNEGEIKWLTIEEMTSTKAAFSDYNTKMMEIFKKKFPNVALK